MLFLVILIYIALDTSNTMVKKQVFDLLCALCMSSEQGFNVCVEAINNQKVISFLVAEPFIELLAFF